MEDNPTSGSERRIATSDRDAWEHASRGDMAGKWYTWCADCGAKNHKTANECKRCGYGSDGEQFAVGNKWNVGRPKYTSDGERGVWDRSLEPAGDRDGGEDDAG